MNYSFNTEHASAYGVEEAIVLHNLVYWIAKNKANGINEHQGRTWTYSSASAFEKLFPFWNARKISRILASLESQGVIVSGHFNKVAYDRTKWYALADESPFVKIDTWKNANCPMDSLDLSNRSAGSVQPIPDRNTYRNTDSKPDISASDRDFDQFWSAYPKKVGKQTARKAWSAKVNKSKPAIEAIIEAVNAAKESKQWSENSGRFIPNPTTWINRHGWDDETDTEKANSSYYDQSKVF